MILIIFFALVWFPFSTVSFPQKDYDLLIIENISVIDVRSDSVIERQNIIVKDDVIESISGEPVNTQVTPGRKIKVIDGTGQFLVPALWDMHVHLTKHSHASAYPAFIQHGITHVRDMRGAHKQTDPFAGVQSKLEEWNIKVNDHDLLGPQLHGYASFAVDGPHAMFDGLPGFFNCRTPEEAIKLVAYFKENRVTLIKVYNNIPREAFFALMKEAKRVGIAVAGHKPVRVRTIEAADAGMKSIEHGRFLIWDSFSGVDSLIAADDPIRVVNTRLRRRMLEEHDTLRLQQNIDALKRNKTWYCPTHLTRRDEAYAHDENFRARYNGINPVLRLLSFEDLDAILQEDTSELGRQVYMDFYLKGLDISGKASRAGVKILAGSDVPELPGSSLHEELVELSKAGLSPFEVLRTATLYPAEYYGLESMYGSIEKGKKADMIILSANPMLSIGNTKAIEGVIFDGKYLDEDAIAALKQEVADRETSIMMSAKLVWDMIVYLTL